MIHLIRHLYPRLFLSRSEKKTLARHVAEFEQATNCELVFHFRKNLKGEPLEETRKLFYKFGLEKTRHRSGILVVLALRNRKLAVWADEGVHRKAGDKLWTEVCKMISDNLKKGHRLSGMILAIELMQKVLHSEQPHDAKEKYDSQLSNEPIFDDEE